MMRQRQALSEAEIRRIIGPSDEQTILDIAKTGASAEELLEAFERASGNTAIGEELERPSSPIVAELIDILTLEEPEPDED